VPNGRDAHDSGREGERTGLDIEGNPTEVVTQFNSANLTFGTLPQLDRAGDAFGLSDDTQVIPAATWLQSQRRRSLARRSYLPHRFVKAVHRVGRNRSIRSIHCRTSSAFDESTEISRTVMLFADTAFASTLLGDSEPI